RDVVHHGSQDTLHDGPQAPGADVPLDGLVGDGLQGLRLELQLHLVVLHQLLVLLHQGVLGLRQDADQILPLQRIQRRDHRQAAHQLRDDAEFQQVVGLDLV
ncbi:Cysteine-rich VLP domain-containing protein, partial [Dysosmobacter welbionis]